MTKLSADTEGAQPLVLRKEAGRRSGGIIFVLPLIAWLGWAIFLAAWSPGATPKEIMSWLAPPLLLLGVLGFNIAKRTPQRTDTLSIDERGIEIVEGTHRRFFAWSEIARIRKYFEGDDPPVEIVAIERLGELTYVPAAGDVRGFPLAADKLVDLLRSRQSTYSGIRADPVTKHP